MSLNKYHALPDNVFGFIVKFLLRPQLLVVAISTVSYPFYYFSLDLPKTIINQVIAGSTETYELLGVEYPLLQTLFILGGIFLVLILVNGLFKLAVDLLGARLSAIGARMLRIAMYRRLRTKFVGQLDGEKVPILLQEPDAIGKVIGLAVVTPVSQGGLLITALIFIGVQSPYLLLGLLPYFGLQFLIVTRLQYRLNQYVRRRLLLIRHASVSLLLGSSAGLDDRELSTFGPFKSSFATFKMLYRLEFISAIWSYLITFVSMIGNKLWFWGLMTVGGYFVLHGDLSIGALVAALAAGKDTAPAVTSLIEFYRDFSVSQTRYREFKQRFDNPVGKIITPY